MSGVFADTNRRQLIISGASSTHDNVRKIPSPQPTVFAGFEGWSFLIANRCNGVPGVSLARPMGIRQFSL